MIICILSSLSYGLLVSRYASGVVLMKRDQTDFREICPNFELNHGVAVCSRRPSQIASGPMRFCASNLAGVLSTYRLRGNKSK